MRSSNESLAVFKRVNLSLEDFVQFLAPERVAVLRVDELQQFPEKQEMLVVAVHAGNPVGENVRARMKQTSALAN